MANKLIKENYSILRSAAKWINFIVWHRVKRFEIIHCIQNLHGFINIVMKPFIRVQSIQSSANKSKFKEKIFVDALLKWRWWFGENANTTTPTKFKQIIISIIFRWKSYSCQCNSGKQKFWAPLFYWTPRDIIFPE